MNLRECGPTQALSPLTHPSQKRERLRTRLRLLVPSNLNQMYALNVCVLNDLSQYQARRHVIAQIAWSE